MITKKKQFSIYINDEIVETSTGASSFKRKCDAMLAWNNNSRRLFKNFVELTQEQFNEWISTQKNNVLRTNPNIPHDSVVYFNNRIYYKVTPYLIVHSHKSQYGFTSAMSSIIKIR